MEQEVIMSPDILIVRDNHGYRILHGHLHLANAMSSMKEVLVEIKDIGPVKVIKTASGYVIHHGYQVLPLV
jgi:hypothetical protein